VWHHDVKGLKANFIPSNFLRTLQCITFIAIQSGNEIIAKNVSIYQRSSVDCLREIEASADWACTDTNSTRK
jgi:hypothetical protein